jgi:hypothetical protein
MFGLLLPTAIAVLVAIGLGGSLARLARVHFAWGWLVFAAFGVELVLYNPPTNTFGWALALGPWVWVATKAGLLLALARNARVDGRWAGACIVMAIGIGLNTLVIVVNDGHMPQSVEAATAVWGPAAEQTQPHSTRLTNVSVMGHATPLHWLADVLPEPGWLPRPNVLSVGDVLLALGMAGWVFSSLRPNLRRSRPVRVVLPTRRPRLEF